jgi:microcystin-dependent protein
VALRREDLFRDDGTDALTVCASVPLAYARLALALTDNYGWRYWGLSDDDEALMESGIGALIEAMSRAGRCGMIGQVIMLATSQLPDNVLLCDGAEYNKNDYPELYAILYPTLLGRDTFNTPDLRDRFVLCEGVTPFGETGGEAEHTLTIAEMPTHTHEYTTALPSVSTVVVPDEPSAVPSPAVTAPAGGNQAHNNMPPYYALIFGIVAK